MTLMPEEQAKAFVDLLDEKHSLEISTAEAAAMVETVTQFIIEQNTVHAQMMFASRAEVAQLRRLLAVQHRRGRDHEAIRDALRCGECGRCQEHLLAPGQIGYCRHMRQMRKYLIEIEKSGAPIGWGRRDISDGRGGVDVSILGYLRKLKLIEDAGVEFSLTDAGYALLGVSK